MTGWYAASLFLATYMPELLDLAMVQLVRQPGDVIFYLWLYVDMIKL